MRLSRRSSLIIACVSVLFAFAWGISTISKGKPAKEIPVGPAPTPTPTPLPGPADSKFVLNEFHRSEVRDGKKMWEIFGTQGQLVSEQNLVRVSNPHVILYKDKGDVVDIKATSADVKLDGSAIGKATLSGNVIVSYNSANTLTTEELVYDRASGRVTSEQRVRVSGDLIEVEGDELRGNLNEKEFTLLKNVRSTLKPKKKL
ncbi:MAG: LPS export ABC transporter periplasmic protein LptC [Oligoflexia bacterium]|nr:LPS export ABC transporter periplasmic protein LptC [Oligoflexia bacterium]